MDVAVDGTLLVTAVGRLWRVAAEGGATPLTSAVTRPYDPGVLAVDALADGGSLYSEPGRVWHVAPDGAKDAIAGSGADSEPRPGPALASPLEEPTEIAQLADGRVVFQNYSPLSGATSAWIVDRGTVSALPRLYPGQDLPCRCERSRTTARSPPTASACSAGAPCRWRPLDAPCATTPTGPEATHPPTTNGAGAPAPPAPRARSASASGGCVREFSYARTAGSGFRGAQDTSAPRSPDRGCRPLAEPHRAHGLPRWLWTAP
jgi:hypothetical protein